MHPHPVSIQQTESLSRASALLSGLEVRHLPVLAGTRLIGMLSDRDLQADRELMDSHRADSSPVSAVLASDVVVVSPDDEISEAIDLMLSHKVGALPVVEAEHVLVGILSYSDLLGAVRDRLASR